MNEMKETMPQKTVGSLAFTMLLASIGVSMPNVALPTLARDFGATFSEVQPVVLSYLLAITIMVVSAGRVGDMFGRRKILLLGVSLFTVGALLGGMAPSLWILIGARALQGIGAATMMALSVAFVSDTVAKEKMGSAMGLMATMSAMGTASGPTVGGAVVAGFGWRGVFFLMAVLGLLSLCLSFRYLPFRHHENRSDRNRFDIIGTMLLGITLVTYSLGVSLNGGHFNEKNGVLIAIALVSGSLFLVTERRVKYPLIRLAVFQNLELSSNLLMNIIVSTVMMSTLIVGPFYLSRGLGLDAIIVGAVMSVGPLMSMMTGLPAGRIVDHLGSSQVTRIGLLTMAVGASSLCFFPQLFGLPGYIVSVVILSPGYQLFQAANNTAVMTNAASDERGVFSGLLSLSRNMGLITGASGMGALFALFSGAPQNPTESFDSIAMGMKGTFSVATVLIFLALMITAFFKYKQKDEE